MAADTTGSINAWDMLPKFTSNPELEAHAIADANKNVASVADLPLQIDAAADDITRIAGEYRAGMECSGSGLPPDGVDSLPLLPPGAKLDSGSLALLSHPITSSLIYEENESFVYSVDDAGSTGEYNSLVQESQSHLSSLENEDAGEFLSESGNQEVSRHEDMIECYSRMRNGLYTPGKIVLSTTPVMPAPLLRAPQQVHPFSFAPTLEGWRHEQQKHIPSRAKAPATQASRKSRVGFALSSRGKVSKVAQQGALRTTVVLQNLPKTYTTSMVVNLVHSVGFKGKCDFVDMPSDRVSRTTGGFAIVNLMNPDDVPLFWKTLDGYTHWKCKSKNKCRVVWYDRLQGLNEIIQSYWESQRRPEGHTRGTQAQAHEWRKIASVPKRVLAVISVNIQVTWFL
eukprot:TRINITY_DN39271_c0_g1_i1.p1 TRINITY_DN39271_c0_g1~~TRINITY_DN39271_c0_g1_i1.p1  ORF type:complete len:398 (+),score=19.40 TRINITY_DN39271_c0_g1_i1:261-1454(+)